MGEVTGIRRQGREQRFSAPAPLTADHDISAFDCGNKPLNDWLRLRALKASGRSARTFVVTAAGSGVIGYYGLAMGAVRLDSAPSSMRRNMPNPVPVAVLARLAVDRNSQGSGIGGALLRDALQRCMSVHSEIGFAAVVVHAIDNDAVAFYLRYGMQEFPAGSRSLFMPIKTIKAALS
jgi:GNAT superfamily N-acetyltransferase